MKNLRSVLTLVAALLGAVVTPMACDADNAFDCQRVCSRYRDCFKSDYDVDGCRSRCRASSEQDATVRAKADACEACIGDMSCLSATFNCAQDCGAIVP
jgi:hypothetical protein